MRTPVDFVCVTISANAPETIKIPSDKFLRLTAASLAQVVFYERNI
jgi:hypothetical protein